MDFAEYLLFVPLLIYGIALSDLFSQWKVFLDREAWYLPYLITLILVTEIGVQNVYNFFKLIPNLDNVNYFTYWIFLFPPLTFMILVNVLTKTEDSADLTFFFAAKTRTIFLLLAAFIAMHFIPQFAYESELWLPRVLGIVACIIFAFWHRMIFFYVLVGVWIVAILSHAYVVYY